MTFDTNNYPLISARIGSVFVNQVFHLADCFHDGLTSYKSTGTRQTFMSGSSQNVQTDTMNKGSAGISGSGGVKGIAQVKVAVTGYGGKETTTDSKSISLGYNVYKSVGIEYLSVNDLTVADLLNGMKDNPKRALVGVLDKFNHLQELEKSLGKDLDEVLQSKPEKYETLRAALTDWASAVEDFHRHYGVGFVAAVEWGALGSVDLRIESKADTSQYKFGGTFNGSVSGEGYGVAVQAAYDGSRSKATANVDVTATSSQLGNSITPLIDAWRNTVEGKATEEIMQVNLIAKLPSLDVSQPAPPDIPEFKKPAKDAKLADKISGIGSKEGLKLYAQAQAYDRMVAEFKEQHPGQAVPSLQDFLQEADQPVDAAALNNVAEQVEEDPLAGVADLFAEPNGEAVQGAEPAHLEHFAIKKTVREPEAGKFAAVPATSTIKEDGAFVPLGVLIIPWTDVFPWLAQGIDNRLGDLTEVKNIIAWRAMIQDAMTLRTIYYLAASAKLTISEYTTPESIGDAFSGLIARLQRLDTSGDYAAQMRTAFDGLSGAAKKIYRTWYENPFMRKAELGYGLVMGHKSLIPDTSLPMIPAFPFFPDYVSPYFDSIGFEESSPDKSAFKSYQKVCAIILPDSQAIATFTEHGFLGTLKISENVKTKKGKPVSSNPDFLFKLVHHTAYEKNETFTSDPRYNGKKVHYEITTMKANFKALEFRPDRSAKCLRLNESKFPIGAVDLYPIAFSAAEGISDWQGGAMGSPALSSFSSLNERLKDLVKQTEQTDKWSFSSDSFTTKNWDADTGLSDLSPKKHYLGVNPLENTQLVNLFSGVVE